MNDSNKILNPKTGRYVLKTGKIGKELLAELKKPKEPKKVDINTLKTEWLSIYNKETKNQITGTLLISIDENDFLDIKLSKTEKIIGITGKGTLILRKLYDIALANRENTEIYLPKNYTGRSYSKPLWNSKHGYMYYKNDTNFKNLKILFLKP